MSPTRFFVFFCIVLLATSSVCEARVKPKELVAAIRAIRRSPRVKAAAIPNETVEKLFRMVMQISSDAGPVTLLVPADLGYLRSLQGQSTAYTLEQMNRIKRFHFFNGALRAANIKALPKNAEIATLEGSSIVKMSGDALPVALLKGRDAVPSILLAGDLYVGGTLVVHVVSSMLVPTDF